MSEQRMDHPMVDEAAGRVHWSFWAIGAVTLIWYSKWSANKGWIS